MWVAPVTLQGESVRLEPLALHHAEDWARHVDLDLFRHFTAIRPPSPDVEGMREFIRLLLAQPDVVPFATLSLATGEAVGGTTFMDIRPSHRGLEIGMTWISREYQGTKINPEAKLLQLTHVFETLDAVRAQLKCDARNLQSQAAITKLGAKFEGRLRRHIVLPDGFVRDTMMYSIVAEEWPEVKAGLQRRLAKE